MRNSLVSIALATAFAIPLAAAGADKGEGPETLAGPIGGEENDYWYDYLADIREAQQELDSDLARATDPEDARDAWDEYYGELADARSDYAGEMAERGIRDGIVIWGGDE
ncbi:hypothetical protein [Parasphingopyxis marina]|uniref:Uncharacterized protein n=1 Tax=Parasphingopyxis marina TaxID=2761622 RepID=A0A842HU36_9SPHN|nr:hypothetical protein [Parasphingopyxis marina]MBC2776445.1 hypothetical protein [Parasphingopyxis marina]